jgi:DNA polymerase-3 subunit beta
MKIRAQQSVLRHALDRVVPAIKPSPVPVLENVLLDARSADVPAGHVRLVGSCGDFVIAVDAPCTIDRPGAITLPAQALRDLIRTFPDGLLTLDVQGERGVLTAGTSQADMAGMSADIYPTPQTVDFGGAAIPANALGDLIARVEFAAATDDAPNGLNGVLLRLRGGTLTAYATDRFRLARAQTLVAGPAQDLADMIVLPKALAAIKRLAAEGQGTVQIGLSDAGTRMGARVPGATLVANVLEGPYPDCDRVIPTTAITVLTTSRTALMQDVSRMLVLANAQTHRTELTLAGSILRLAATRQDRGSVRGELSVAVQAGDRLSIGVNGRFLHDILDRIPSEQVEISYTSAERPIVLRPMGGLDGGAELVYVLMPLRAAE